MFFFKKLSFIDQKNKKTKFLKIINPSKKNISSIKQVQKIKIEHNNSNLSKKIVVIIDAGHGGQDPGAIGYKGLQEKQINIKIALKVKKLLDNNKMFHTILIRNNDSYFSMKKRNELIKKNYVDFLVSIHADSSEKKYVSGASIWMISNDRMNREIKDYIKNNEDIVCFSENIRNIFKQNQNDLYLKKTILDLQFKNFQKIEIDFSKHVLEQFKKITNLHKTYPNYASLGILSSINIPSLLIETGFITNALDGQKLKTEDYQKKVANSIYLALNNYFQNTS